jgi:hypothetical protein
MPCVQIMKCKLLQNVNRKRPVDAHCVAWEATWQAVAAKAQLGEHKEHLSILSLSSLNPELERSSTVDYLITHRVGTDSNPMHYENYAV